MAAPVSTAADPPRKPAGKKIAGMSPMTLIVILGIGVVGGAWFLLRRSKAQAAATDTTGSAQGTAESQGNDFAGQIATLQTEIADLQGALSGEDSDPHANAGAAHRNIADGTRSLDQVATERHTSSAHIIAVTRASTEISDANLARFNKYVAGGTGRKMPAGLVFYTTHAGSEPGAENEGGGGSDSDDGGGSGGGGGGGGGGTVDPGGPNRPPGGKTPAPKSPGPKPNPGGRVTAPTPSKRRGVREHPGTGGPAEAPPRRAAAHHNKRR